MYREQGVKVEISHDGEWLTGTTLELLEVRAAAATSELLLERDLSEKDRKGWKTGWCIQHCSTLRSYFWEDVPFSDKPKFH